MKCKSNKIQKSSHQKHRGETAELVRTLTWGTKYIDKRESEAGTGMGRNNK